MLKTALHNAHTELNAKMGEFAGYDMPLFYDTGVLEEHKWVRKHAGIFDVSHMGQITVEGPGAAEFWERVTPSAFQPKAVGRAQYTVLLNEQGGIIDDLIVTRMADDKFMAVVNAARKDEDIKWLKAQLPDGLRLRVLDDHSLIALQGAWAERILYETLRIETREMPYMHARMVQGPALQDITVSRLGYTGEDGFEISLPSLIAEDVWHDFSSHPEIRPIGLAARDTLRLEMGYPLYGHDIDESTSPVEAGLSWIISKKTEGYFGYDRIRAELTDGPKRVRAGIKLLDKGVAREGSKLLDAEGIKIGALTSGGFSPTLEASIGMAYVPPQLAEPGTKVAVDVRGRQIEAEICALPFIEPKTKAMKKG